MNIRFVSTLTPEDENHLAPALLKSLAAILDLLPISYMLRVDTADGQVYQQAGPAKPPAADDMLQAAKPIVSFDS